LPFPLSLASQWLFQIDIKLSKQVKRDALLAATRFIFLIELEFVIKGIRLCAANYA